MPDRHLRRAGTSRLVGRNRSRYLARRIGVGLRESRVALQLTQATAASRAGISQGFWSRVEHGLCADATLETLAACAAAVDLQLAAFLEARPGADLPRDIAHLRGQALVIRVAREGGWQAFAERPIDPQASRSRSVDVELRRPTLREVAIVELVDLVADAGQDMRGLADKVAAVRRELPEQRVSGLLAVRSTRRNRALVAELEPVFEARFPASSVTWIAALGDPTAPMPDRDGLVWVRVDGTGLFARRRSL